MKFFFLVPEWRDEFYFYLYENHLLEWINSWKAISDINFTLIVSSKNWDSTPSSDRKQLWKSILSKPSYPVEFQDKIIPFQMPTSLRWPLWKFLRNTWFLIIYEKIHRSNTYFKNAQKRKTAKEDEREKFFDP